MLNESTRKMLWEVNKLLTDEGENSKSIRLLQKHIEFVTGSDNSDSDISPSVEFDLVIALNTARISVEYAAKRNGVNTVPPQVQSILFQIESLFPEVVGYDIFN